MTPNLQRKRQARGEARIQALLKAAETVFARTGYSRATTNEIAAEAEVSPATLYQFFSNKESIANALAATYVERMGQQHDALKPEDLVGMPARDMVRKLVAPMFKFHELHPAFISLLMDAPLSDEIRDAKIGLSTKFIEKLSQVLLARNALLLKRDAHYQSEIAMMLFKGFICEIHLSSGSRKKKLTESLIDLMTAHMLTVESNTPSPTY